MLQITVNKATNKASVVFDGKEQTLSMVKVNKPNVKPGTYWVNMQVLGTPKKWATVNYNDHAEDVFVIEVDETSCRVQKAKYRRAITLQNIKDFLSEEDGTVFDELMEKATAKQREIEEQEKANAPVKEKKSRAMTDDEYIAKMEAKLAEAKAKRERGESVKPVRKAKSKIEVEDLDLDDDTQEATQEDSGAF